jgi:accessory colonization factor AcfC
MKEKSIYKNVLKYNEKIENFKKPKNQKTSKFKCTEVSVLIIWVSVSVSNPGDGASDVVL